MNRIKLVLVFAVVLGLLMGPVVVKHAMAAAQTNCPVISGKVDEKIFTDYQGKRIYFCCAACIDEFKKDPAKYMKKLEEEKVDLAPSPAK